MISIFRFLLLPKPYFAKQPEPASGRCGFPPEYGIIMCSMGWIVDILVSVVSVGCNGILDPKELAGNGYRAPV